MIGSWYYTSELPAQEAANLRAAMVSKDCESLEAWLKTSVHDADRKARLYALLRHAAFESWLAGLGPRSAVSPIPMRKIAQSRPNRGRVLGTILRAALRAHKASKALRRRHASSALDRRRRKAPTEPLRRRAARGTVPKGYYLLGAGLEVSPTPSTRRRPFYLLVSARNNYHYLSYTH